MNRNHYLKTRLSAVEHAQLKARAARLGITTSDYVRTALLYARTMPREQPIAPVAISPVADPSASAAGPLYAYQRKSA
jgi:hypothetical protein